MRAASALTLTIGIVGCSPTVNDSIDQQQSFAASSSDAAQVGADASDAGAPAAQKKKKTAAGDAAAAPAEGEAGKASAAPTETEAAKTDAAKPEDGVKTAEEAKPQADEQAVATAKADAAEAPSSKPTETADAAAPAAVTAVADAQPAPAPKQQKGLFSALFSNNKANQPKTEAEKPVQVASAAPGKTAFAATSQPAAATNRQQQVLENPSPNLSFESINSAPKPRNAKLAALPEVRANAFADDGEGTGLPGVRKSALFDIKRKSGVDDDSDVDIHEDADGGVQVAMAPGLARLSPNGLLKQRDSVDVACLKPSLIRQIRILESKFGKKAVITSGYRSPNYNRSVRGAKNSQHMYCAAVDLQIPGVSKWELANYARSVPGRGGVGTYCHTDSVHVDVGPERDWNWRCRGRRS